MERHIAELQATPHQAELNLKDQRAKIAVVPALASMSPEITGADQTAAIADAITDILSNTYGPGPDWLPETMKAPGRRKNSISCRATIILRLSYVKLPG